MSHKHARQRGYRVRRGLVILRLPNKPAARHHRRDGDGRPHSLIFFCSHRLMSDGVASRQPSGPLAVYLFGMEFIPRWFCPC